MGELTVGQMLRGLLGHTDREIKITEYMGDIAGSLTLALTKIKELEQRIEALEQSARIKGENNGVVDTET